MSKVVDSLREAVSDIRDGSVILVGGFGEVGTPFHLLDGLLESGATDLTIVANNAGTGEHGIAALLRDRRVRKVVCSFPRSAGSIWFERRYRAGEVELEVIPQGTLSERIRAAGAGIGGFFTPTAVGTALGAGKEMRVIDGRRQLLEYALSGDVALINAHRGDPLGNLTYHASARNFGPTMAMAARLTVAEVTEVVPLGGLDPEIVVTPGIFVDRMVVSDARA